METFFKLIWEKNFKILNSLLLKLFKKTKKFYVFNIKYSINIKIVKLMFFLKCETITYTRIKNIIFIFKFKLFFYN